MLIIPSHINADALLPFLVQLARHADDETLTLDFKHLQRISPAGLTAITAFLAGRDKRKLETRAIGLDECPIRDYLRRMNLLLLCGWEGGEELFERRDSTGKFVPLEPITHDVENLSNKIAACIAPGGDAFENENSDLYDAAFYLLSELANNAHQHSRGHGFVAAQATKFDGFVKIAIADCGCGIATSLKDAGLSWTEGIPDEDIIEQALVARVTSKGQPANEGVGLTLCTEIIHLMGGDILIMSGAGLVIDQKMRPRVKQPLGGDAQFPGTLVALTFRRSEAANFYQKLQNAKKLHNLLLSSKNAAIFRP